MSEAIDRGRPGRAIITYARGWQSLAATRSLGRRGVDVVTGDEFALTPSSFSRYSIADFRYPSPTAEPEKFLDVLEETIIKYKPDDPDAPYVLMPIHKETYLIAEHRERFEPHIRVPVPDLRQIEQVHNKGTLAAYALDRGLSIPDTWMPRSIEEFVRLAPDISLPAFVKLRESAAGVGIQKVDTREELEETFRDFVKRYGLRPDDYPVIQQGVPGDDYCVTTLFDRGKLVACMTYRNIRQFPADTGAGVVRETVEVKEMERVATEVLGPLGWHGVAELDFRWTGNESDPAHLIEVNPRFWGGLKQAIASGWDYPWLLYRLAVDGKVESPEEGRYDVRTETPILGLLATLKEISENDRRMEDLKEAWRRARHEFKDGSKRRGLRKTVKGLKDFLDVKNRVSEAKKMLDVHKNNVYDVLSVSDPLPTLGVLYPLAVFFKHGKVNMELLTSEGGPKEAAADDDVDDSAHDDAAESSPLDPPKGTTVYSPLDPPKGTDDRDR